MAKRPVDLYEKVSKTLAKYDKGKAKCKDLYKLLRELEEFYG